MKYASVFVTIVLIWVAVILMVVTRPDAGQVFELYLTGIVSTVVLFLIGFGRK